MKAIKFNTKRTYTPEGQIVVAWVHSEETDEWGHFVLRPLLRYEP